MKSDNNNVNSEIMDYQRILKIVASCAEKKETVEIYYPETENSSEGWREIEPYGLSTDIKEEGENLVYDKDIISPGHILNGYTLGSHNRTCHSFIIGKIKKARRTGRNFTPRNNWKINF
jgi:hypothetical protein